MQVTVEVTQECINKGTPSQLCDCPVWHAIQPLIRASYLMMVTCANLLVTPDDDSFADDDDQWCRLHLPADATRFIDRLDDGLPVAPFSFDLDIPDKFLAEVQS